MVYLYSILFLGFATLIAQIIYEFTDLTPGHITTIYVLAGILLESFGIYDFLIEHATGGALLPILNFGHLLSHAVVEGVKTDGFMGIFTAMLTPVSASLVFTVTISGLLSLVRRPRP